MKKLDTIRQTWTYNHKLLLVTISLATALVVPLVPVPTWPDNAVGYEKPQAVFTLEQHVEARARELYQEREAMDLEKYRQEAIQELGGALLEMSVVSPYVDYDALRDEYGY